MSDPLAFHAGELAVQDRVGVRDEAARVHAVVGDTVSAAAAQFLAQQRVLAIGATDPAGRIWASVLLGEPGFVEAIGPRTVDVRASFDDGDPLGFLATAPGRVGTVAIDFAARRRVRVNGSTEPVLRDTVLCDPVLGGFRIAIDQVYGNCPRYIHPRNPTAALRAAPGTAASSDALTPSHQALIRAADTFFVASRSAAGDVDASHRGGEPGFVEVLSPTRLRLPDHPGNNMFMSLGNLAQDPAAGLVFVDWSTGTSLQLTGTARIDWGADRAVEFEVERVVSIGR